MHIILERDSALESAIDWCLERDVNYRVVNNWPSPTAIFSLNTSDDDTLTAFTLQFYNSAIKIWRG
jgi:hypothetical protein